MSRSAPMPSAAARPAAALAARAAGWPTSWFVALGQAAFSGGNFLTIALVGRSAGRGQLGLYAVVMSLVVLASAFLRAMVVTPYTFQSQRLAGRRRDLRRGSAMAMAVGVAALMAAAVGVAWPLLLSPLLAGGDQPTLAGGVAAAAVAGWGLRECCRRLLFADHRFREAAAVDGVIAAAQSAAVATLAATGRLDAAAALLAMAAAGGVVSLGWLAATRRRFPVRRRRLARDAAATWGFGKWSAMSEAVYVGQEAGVQALLAAGGGLAVAGGYAACASIVRLTSPFLQAVGNAAGPACARDLAERGRPGLLARTRRVTAMVGVAMAAFVAGAAVLGGMALNLVYGAGSSAHAPLLLALAVAAGVGALGLAPAKAISALERPRVNFAINLIGLAVTLTIAAAGQRRDAVAAVAAALLTGAATTTALRWWAVRRLQADRRRKGGA